jgi:hypothetical protein
VQAAAVSQSSPPTLHPADHARPGRVLLSFDAEEFDLPLERGQTLSLDEQMAVGGEGLRRTLDLLDTIARERGGREPLPATFFCTAVFAERFPDLIARAVAAGHEIASHGVVHGASAWRDEHLRESRERLERVSGTPCRGFRRPRLTQTDRGLIAAAGYRYNSSENPTWLPGRYNNFFQPRLPYERPAAAPAVTPPSLAPGTPAQPGLLNIPASVTPVVRFPLFWLSFKVCPLSVTKLAARSVLARDPALVLYFHPWELCDLSRYRVPAYVKACDGSRMTAKLGAYLRWLAARRPFVRYADFADTFRANPAASA